MPGPTPSAALARRRARSVAHASTRASAVPRFGGAPAASAQMQPSSTTRGAQAAPVAAKQHSARATRGVSPNGDGNAGTANSSALPGDPEDALTGALPLLRVADVPSTLASDSLALPDVNVGCVPPFSPLRSARRRPPRPQSIGWPRGAWDRLRGFLKPDGSREGGMTPASGSKSARGGPFS